MSAPQSPEPLLVEQRRRWRAGERAQVEAYLHAQPALRATPETILDLIYNELLLREEDGEAPRLEEYLGRFPELAAPLRLLFEVDRALLSQGLLRLTLAKDLSASLTAPRPGPAAAAWPAIAGYEVLGVLGQGGTGIVYKAWHEGLKRLVALKRLRGGANSDERTRFRAEAETVARLQHPNIVQIFEVGEAAAGDGMEPVPFLAMEFVDGGSLDRVLAGTPLPPRDAASLVALLAHALQHAHAQGVVHRDLKPANILLQRELSPSRQDAKQDQEEQKERQQPSSVLLSFFASWRLGESSSWLPKISDFGLAKRLDADAGQTQTGAILGTPSYMAPEQAAGQARAAGPAADVYALGAILYECLTGRPPFKAATVLDTLAQVLADEPVPPRRLQPKVPRDLQTVCLKCLEKDPARRYPSAAALADELRRFLEDRPIRARPVGPIPRLARWCRRNPAWATLAGLVGLFVMVALAAGIGFGIYQSQAAERYRYALGEAQKQRREADRRAAQLALDQGLGLCDRGQVGDGLFVLARGLEFALRSDQPQLERVLRINLASWSKGLHPLRRQLDIGVPVYGAAYSPDGRLVLIGEDNGNARFWDPATGQSVGPPLHNDGVVSVVAFSPDGRLALTADFNSAVFLWDAVTHLPLQGPLRHEGGVRAAAFRPDGNAVATAGGDKTVRLWSTATGQPFPAPLVHPESVTCLAFSPDGRFLVTGSMDGFGRLWDTANGTVLRTTPWLNALYGVAFSPDGRTVLTGGGDRIVRIWDANLTQVVRTLAPQPGGIKALALTPDGRTLVSVEESFAQVWDVTSGRALGLPVEHGGDVSGTAISPNSRTFLTVGTDRTVRFWEANHPGPGEHLLRHDGPVVSAAFSPDARTALTGSQDNTARQWDIATGKAVGPPLRHASWVEEVAFSPDGSTVLTRSRDAVYRWDAATGALRSAPLPHGGHFRRTAFSPDGQTVLKADDAGDLRLWNTATGTPLGPPFGRVPWLSTMTISPDGRRALLGGSEKAAWLAELGPTPTLGPALAHPVGVWCVAFAPDSERFATCCWDGTTRVWETQRPEAGGLSLATTSMVEALAFSPEGAVLLTGTVNKTAWLWDTATGKPLGPPLRHQDRVGAVAFAADGETVLTGSYDNTARLWDAATGKPLGPPLTHADIVRAVAFSPDGRTVLTASRDATARLWSVPAPMTGDPERILLELEVLTGMETDDTGTRRPLDGAAWRERRQRLEVLRAAAP